MCYRLSVYCACGTKLQIGARVVFDYYFIDVRSLCVHNSAHVHPAYRPTYHADCLMRQLLTGVRIHPCNTYAAVIRIADRIEHGSTRLSSRYQIHRLHLQLLLLGKSSFFNNNNSNNKIIKLS